MISFGSLRVVNVARAKRWHKGFLSGEELIGNHEWSGADWSNAMCGEAGEAANVVKKIRRYETGTQSVNDPPITELVRMLAEECADTVIYLDLLAAKYNIDLGRAVRSKFNIVSAREGFPEYLMED
jgi:NTP pyrophosphatase (non-canonical NTP hydrolase)